MFKTSINSIKHVFFYFYCIGHLYYIVYNRNTTTFYVILCIVISYKKYDIVCGFVSCNFSLPCPIKVYKQFILRTDSHRSRIQKELLIYFCKLVALYLNRIEELRNRTNHGIVVFWCYIGIFILNSIYAYISC